MHFRSSASRNGDMSRTVIKVYVEVRYAVYGSYCSKESTIDCTVHKSTYSVRYDCYQSLPQCSDDVRVK